MPIVIVCTSCQRKLRVPDNLLGKKVKCPACQNSFTAAAEEEIPTVEPEEEVRVQKRKPMPPPPKREPEKPKPRPVDEDDDGKGYAFQKEPPPPPREEYEDEEDEEEDEEEEERPRRRKRKGRTPGRSTRSGISGGQMNFFDRTFGNTNIVILILFALCCGGIALVFGILGIILCTDREARQRAILVVVIEVIAGVIWGALSVGSALMNK
jgi:hypothetical protein